MNSSYTANKINVVLTILLSIAIMICGNNLVQAAVIEGKFDTSNGVNVISGDFISNTLSPGTVPAIDGQIQAVLQTGGYSYAPFGMSITGEARGCKDGIFFGNLYLTTDPRLTAFWGVDAIIFIPAGMVCGTGVGDTPFGAGEAILFIYVGPQVPSGYFSSVDALMVSGSSVAINDGLNGMFLRLDPIQ